MSWIDEAEKRKHEQENAKERVEKIQKINLQENYKHFRSFAEELSELLHRVNNLSYEEKKPCLELGFTEIEENTCYEYYGSAYIYKKGFFIFFTGSRYKVLCWRRINFKIAEEFNIVKVHVKEIYAEKDKGLLTHSEDTKDKFKLRIDGLNKEFLQTTINWLTFKCSNHDFKKSLPFAHSSNSHKHH